MSALRRNLPVYVAIAVALVVSVVAYRIRRGPMHVVVKTTVGEVQAVHAEVTSGGDAVRGVARFGAGDAIETGDTGRARLRLDDGTLVVVDRATRLVAKENGFELVRGRAFAWGGGTHAFVDAAGAHATIPGASVAIAKTDAGATFTCSNGEAVVAKGGDHRVRSGETATVSASEVRVVPEKAFVDWTGGMAAPWGPRGKPRASIGELWGRTTNDDDAGTPLAIRRHEVTARIDGELARTHVETTYFNAGDRSFFGDFRMAIPPGALVSRFAIQSGSASVQEAKLALAKDDAVDTPRLEWAGEGWVRGNTGILGPGDTITTIVEYVEWLSPAGDRMTYRYPMVSEGKAPSIGELRVRVDATGAKPRAMHVPAGARVDGAVVELTAADAKPTSDMVVELELEPNALGAARAYVAPAEKGDDGGAFLLVRTEAPPAPKASGVEVVLVVDSSLSIDPALLDAERALVEATLEGLGQNDVVHVFAADQTLRPIASGKVDDALRAKARAALRDLVPGGATDLGLALADAADSATSPSALVVYVGDGWATLGDATVEELRARLSRRQGGIPRLGAVAVGPLANRFALTSLVRGTGPVLEIGDRAEAASVATTLVAEALRPTAGNVEVDLGPGVDRVYPRGAKAVPEGTTITIVGRLRGAAPSDVHVRWQGPNGAIDDVRGVYSPSVVDVGDVRRRWGAGRVEELAMRGEGRESAVDVALRVKLLTPWTAFALQSPYKPTPLATRVLDLAVSADAPLSAKLATRGEAPGTLMEAPLFVPTSAKGDDDLETAVVAAAKRTIDGAMKEVRACRDARAVLRPEIGGELRVHLAIDGKGRAKKVSVRAASPTDDDPALDRCVEVVIASLGYFESDATSDVVVDHALRLPPPRDVRAHACSSTSTLPLALRRGIWRERLDRSPASAVYLRAKAACELPTWTDRRALLELVLDAVRGGVARIELARSLESSGDADAAELLRREAIRRAATPDELRAVRLAVLGDERNAPVAFHKAFSAAKSDRERLDVVRRFLRLAPHDPELRRRLLQLLVAVHDEGALRAEIQRTRQDPFADAGLLADGADVLLALGGKPEAIRAYGELLERAPEDPFARAYLGDRLRNQGLFDEATTVTTSLVRALPDDPSATLRLALAHLGAHRVDVAARLFARVAQTGGRYADARFGELAAASEIALASSDRAKAAPDEAARLDRRLAEVPLPDAGALVLVKTDAALDVPLAVSLLRDKDRETKPDVAAPSMGLSLVRLERGEKAAKLRLANADDLGRRDVRADVFVIVPQENARPRTFSVTKTVGKDPVEIAWDGAAPR